MFPDYSGSNYVSFVPAYSFALAYFSSGDLYVSACVLLSFLPFACQTAHLRFSRVACNLPLFPLACQVLPTAFFNLFSLPSHRSPRMQLENTARSHGVYPYRQRAFADCAEYNIRAWNRTQIHMPAKLSHTQNEIPALG